MNSRAICFISGALFFLAFSENVQAYLDPGSASLAVQAVIAAFAGAALTWKHWWSHFKGWCKKLVVLLGFKSKMTSELVDSEKDNSSSSRTDSPCD